jgi:hypothetical protein
MSVTGKNKRRERPWGRSGGLIRYLHQVSLHLAVKLQHRDGYRGSKWLDER